MADMTEEEKKKKKQQEDQNKADKATDYIGDGLAKSAAEALRAQRERNKRMAEELGFK